MGKRKIIVLAGPTASGKTDFAKYLIEKFNGEVISADSRQVYCGLDIGSGKDKSFFQYLIDIRKPEEKFTVADFQKEASRAVEEIYQKGKIPFIVGGSGFYIDAFLKNKRLAPPGNPKLREKLERKSPHQLFEQLKKLDSKTAAVIDKNNKRRLVRALEVCLESGRAFSSFGQESPPKFDVLYLVVDLPRQILYQKIDQRLEKRLEEGMIEEVENLLKQGVSPKWLKSLGLEYRYITEYLEGRYPKEEMIEKLKYAIHRFARRQITWFKKNKEAIWIKDIQQAEKLIEDFLSK
jgi:tRNA dimethylallyltransferase